jgi:hypothetical protein
MIYGILKIIFSDNHFPDPPGNDEVSDPVMSAASDFHHPKKASYGDSMRYSVSAHQVDSDRMDDIFFTSK